MNKIILFISIIFLLIVLICCVITGVKAKKDKNISICFIHRGAFRRAIMLGIIINAFQCFFSIQYGNELTSLIEDSKAHGSTAFAKYEGWGDGIIVVNEDKLIKQKINQYSEKITSYYFNASLHCLSSILCITMYILGVAFITEKGLYILTYFKPKKFTVESNQNLIMLFTEKNRVTPIAKYKNNKCNQEKFKMYIK